MTQNYYSKRTVDKLRAHAQLAETNFSSTLAENVKLVTELQETKAELERFRGLFDRERTKTYDLETKLGLRNSYNNGCDKAQADVKRDALQRAHEELHKVKPTDTNTMLLQRAIGNAQGILAAAIDANGQHAQSISLYPDDDKKVFAARPVGRGF